MTAKNRVTAACVAVLCGVVSLNAFAQVAGTNPAKSQPTATKPAELGSIEGLVVKSGGNEPIRRAQVTLTRAEDPGQSVRVYTDSAGKFVFRDLVPGRYVLIAERQGYVRQAFGQGNLPGMFSQSSSSLRLAGGQKVQDVVFRLVPWAVISGRVTDEEGEAMTGASVEVLRYVYVRGRRQLQRTQGGSTNDLGEFRIYGLQPGRYFVSASYIPGWRVVSRGDPMRTPQTVGDESYAATYYPGTTDPSRALPLELRGGQQVSGLDFNLQLQPTLRVRGRVLNGQTGQPQRGATVMLVPRDPELRPFFFRNQATTQSVDGEFEIRGAVAGAYYVTAGWGDQGRSLSARSPVDISSSDVEGIVLTLAPGFVLEGRVRIEGGGELPVDNRLRIGDPQTGGVLPVRASSIRVSLVPTEDAWMGVSNTAVRADGGFTIRDIPPAKYRPSVAGAPESYFLKSAQLGGRNILESGLDLSGSPGAPLELILSPNGARVEGVVVADGEQVVSGAVVVLVPDAARRQQWTLYRTVSADTSGRFSIAGIPPGEYKLFAWPELEPGAHMDPEFLRPYEDKGVVVRLEESGRYSQELKLLPQDTRLP